MIAHNTEPTRFVNEDWRRMFRENPKGLAEELAVISRVITDGFEDEPPHLRLLARAVRDLAYLLSLEFAHRAAKDRKP